MGIVDPLKRKEQTKDKIQTVKLAAKNLLNRLNSGKPKVLIIDWHRDKETSLQAWDVIKTVLDNHLPPTYDRAVYATKCDAVFDHYYIMAAVGDSRVFA